MKVIIALQECPRVPRCSKIDRPRHLTPSRWSALTDRFLSATLPASVPGAVNAGCPAKQDQKRTVSSPAAVTITEPCSSTSQLESLRKFVLFRLTRGPASWLTLMAWPLRVVDGTSEGYLGG